MKDFIEKLIGRLEELRDRYQDKYGFCSDSVDYGKTIGLNDAISIVNQLAEEYNNDVCEWEYWRTIDDTPMYKTTCLSEFEERFVKKYKFCPYCGKKIKVVE